MCLFIYTANTVTVVTIERLVGEAGQEVYTYQQSSSYSRSLTVNLLRVLCMLNTRSDSFLITSGYFRSHQSSTYVRFVHLYTFKEV